MKAAFLILSAINQQSVETTDPLAQLQQRLITLNSQFEQSPNALIEYSETALSDEQKQQILPHADLLAEFRPNELLLKLKNKLKTTNHPNALSSYNELLKIIALNWFLQNAHGANLFKEIDCVVIIDSSAELDQDMIDLLNKPEAIKDKFFFKKARNRPIQNEKSQSIICYPTDTWAYSTELTDELINSLVDASENSYKQLKSTTNATTVNLGHELFKTIDLAKIHFLI